ncbi:MAG TPA: helix-turn-helix domain-containing protein [Polyangiaceae bacterium]|nr:helix-turn-helix domain-containing protein [Polyangiaceae bacterium]
MTRAKHSRTDSEPITLGPPLPALLTAQEVAAWLQISVQAVYAKAERGGLPGATRLGRRLYFLRAELLRSVEQGRVPYLGDAHGGT